MWSGSRPEISGADTQLMLNALMRSLNKKDTPKRVPFCGVGRNRTGDTRIFSPLLYRLSYRTLENLRIQIPNSKKSIYPVLWDLNLFSEISPFWGCKYSTQYHFTKKNF